MPVETNGCGSNQTIGLSWGLTRSATTVYWLNNNNINTITFSNNSNLIKYNSTATNLKGFNGQEKYDEINGENNHISFADFGYDVRLGRRWTIDNHAAKFPNIAPYAGFNNNPLIYVDPSGKDVILIIWATGNGGYGHAAIAVSNYKKEYFSVFKNGVEVPMVRYVKDGTYTYYDLWPGKDINGDGSSDVIGEAGPKDMYSGPIAHYQVFKNLTQNDLVNGDPSGAEEKTPDGVIKLYSTYTEDMETIADIEDHMEDNKEYTSVMNNCTDFAATGVAESLDRSKGMIELQSDEWSYGINYTTPNGLYKYVQERIESNPKEGTQLKDPGAKIDVKFEDAVITPQK